MEGGEQQRKRAKRAKPKTRVVDMGSATVTVTAPAPAPASARELELEPKQDKQPTRTELTEKEKRRRAGLEALQQITAVDNRRGPEPGTVKNKFKRRIIHQRQVDQKRKDLKEKRKKIKELREKLGEDAPPKQEPRTIESMRVSDGTIIDEDDEEIRGDEETDEFADYFSDGRAPKVLVTTSNKPVGKTFKFAEELINVIPSAEFKPRRGFALKTIVKQASAKGYTDLIVINEDQKKPNMMLMMHLPAGPTAFFKLTNIKLGREIRGHGKPTMHYPEVVTSGFSTRLGKYLSRMFVSLFPQGPEFEGRSVVNFHVQRDFIFVRRYRYVFRSKEKVGVQELGPRFTLKLLSLQKGTFDSKYGEYEFVGKNKFYVDRKKHYL